MEEVVGDHGHRPGRDTFWLAVCPAIAAEMLTCVVEFLVEWGRRLAYDC